MWVVCANLWSRCPTLLLTILDVLLDVLLRDVDMGTILLHSHVRLDDMVFFSFLVTFPITLLMMIWMLIPIVLSISDVDRRWTANESLDSSKPIRFNTLEYASILFNRLLVFWPNTL